MEPRRATRDILGTFRTSVPRCTADQMVARAGTRGGFAPEEARRCGDPACSPEGVKEAALKARLRAAAKTWSFITFAIETGTTCGAEEIGSVTGHNDSRMLKRYYNKRPHEFVERFQESFIR